MIKKCTKCGNEFPATKDYFRVANNSKDGLRRECKLCQDIAGKEYREKNKQKIAEKKSIYANENKDRLRAKRKDYWLKNKNELLQRKKINYNNNRDKISLQQKEYYKKNKGKVLGKNKVWRQENRDKVYEVRKKYAQENKEKVNTYKNKWKEKHPEYVKEYQIKYKDKHNESNKKYRKTLKGILTSNNHTNKRRAKNKELEASLTKRQWLGCKKYFNNKCCYCGREEELQQEHFIPLSKGGEYAKSNIIVACKQCNCSKSNNDFFKWYPEQEFYSPKRESKILKYLGYNKTTKNQQLALDM